MQTIRTIGLDIAKSIFQVHGVDAAGNVIVRRKLKRRYVLSFFHKLPLCLVGIEACASSHHLRHSRATGSCRTRTLHIVLDERSIKAQRCELYCLMIEQMRRIDIAYLGVL
jgi:hypothetical protein